MNSIDDLKPGKRENAYFVRREWDTEKIGVQSPYNKKFYAYVWDRDLEKTVPVLMTEGEMEFED